VILPGIAKSPDFPGFLHCERTVLLKIELLREVENVYGISGFCPGGQKLPSPRPQQHRWNSAHNER